MATFNCRAHWLFDRDYREIITYPSGMGVEYATCEDHAHHCAPGGDNRYLCVSAPVFGPDRPAVATAAVRTLARVQAEYDEAPMMTDWTRGPRMEARLLRARVERDFYREYGDSFANAI